MADRRRWLPAAVFVCVAAVGIVPSVRSTTPATYEATGFVTVDVARADQRAVRSIPTIQLLETLVRLADLAQPRSGPAVSASRPDGASLVQLSSRGRNADGVLAAARRATVGTASAVRTWIDVDEIGIRLHAVPPTSARRLPAPSRLPIPAVVFSLLSALFAALVFAHLDRRSITRRHPVPS